MFPLRLEGAGWDLGNTDCKTPSDEINISHTILPVSSVTTSSRMFYLILAVI